MLEDDKSTCRFPSCLYMLWFYLFEINILLKVIALLYLIPTPFPGVLYGRTQSPETNYMQILLYLF